jgi:hypothetical protein
MARKNDDKKTTVNDGLSAHDKKVEARQTKIVRAKTITQEHYGKEPPAHRTEGGKK